MIRCEFCEGNCHPVYQVGLGSLTSTLHQCENCCSAHVDPPFPAESVTAFYANTYLDAAEWQRKKSAILATDYFGKIRRFLPAGHGVKALDVGAGYGDFARFYKTRTGNDIDIVEPSVAGRNMISNQVQAGEVYSSVAELPAGAAYHQIFCFHVVEHLQEFTSFVSELCARLAQGGRLFILTPNGASTSFRDFGRDWGWACPEQHHQFLSDQIPGKYFNRLGFSVVMQESVCPAVIHYPSRWFTRMQRGVRELSVRVEAATGPRRWLLQGLRRLLVEAESAVAQNRSQFNATFFEKQLSRCNRYAHQDELLLVLEKN